jgi:carbamate kinase
VRIVAALGGNALLRRGEAPEADAQVRHVTDAAEALSPLVVGNELVVTHGNGPQVGVLALESAADPSLLHPYPFDVLVAETQGLIGNWILSALGQAAPWTRAVCLLTRTVVDESDAAFFNPTKFVGPVYSKAQAQHLISEWGWQMRQDGSRWRRVVASPEPLDIIEVDEIELLLKSGHVVICAGGGGVPVVRDTAGYWRDVEAVVDKDLTAAVLAIEMGADALLLLTDVPFVELDFGTPDARPIRHTTADALRALSFPAGSMAPKVEAACRFAEAAGGMAAIGRLQDAPKLLRGDAGTIVTRAPNAPTGRPPEAPVNVEVEPCAP